MEGDDGFYAGVKEQVLTHVAEGGFDGGENQWSWIAGVLPVVTEESKEEDDEEEFLVGSEVEEEGVFDGDGSE